jgi:DNA-binding GntR family transcriptional regulator
MQKSYEEHREIAELAAIGDTAAAIQVLNGHIGRKEGSYWQLGTTPKPVSFEQV